MLSHFYVCFNDLIVPLAIKAHRLIAEWQTEPDEDFEGRFRDIKQELYLLAFPESPTIYLLRRLNCGDLENPPDPIGDELLVDIEAAKYLADAGITLTEPLEEIEREVENESGTMDVPNFCKTGESQVEREILEVLKKAAPNPLNCNEIAARTESRYEGSYIRKFTPNLQQRGLIIQGKGKKFRIAGS